jgi:UDP-N-acetyl-alpha-D-muramoyl-L-alanyl-L-glutamate epimerase
MRVLRLTEVAIARTSISAACAIEDLRFHATVWYDDIDLHELAREHGSELVERLALHVALFQLNAVVSLRPDVVDLGTYARHLTPELAALWRTVATRVWAQWRWEHELQDYVPQFANPLVSANGTSVQAPMGPTPLLAFCGGGKDSLVALRLLERGKLPFATLAYAHSIYGAAEPQHALIDRVASATARTRAERQWIVDDFLDAPIVRTRPDLGIKSLLAAETPASVFAALPLALARGYTGLVVAHEASANAANLEWRGEQVNHQWGKSWDAEQLLDRYVRTQLLSNVRYFSVLAPIHDEVIFELLSRDAHLVPLTHSCNIAKPWCGQCAKCAYVWLQFAAHLPSEIVHQTFGANLGERAANDRHFRELLGLAEHSPFECVGSVPEARLALALAHDRNALGPRLLSLAAEVEAHDAIDIATLARPLVEVGERHGMPPEVADAVMPQLRSAAADASSRLLSRASSRSP